MQASRQRGLHGGLNGVSSNHWMENNGAQVNSPYFIPKINNLSFNESIASIISALQ